MENLCLPSLAGVHGYRVNFNKIRVRAGSKEYLEQVRLILIIYIIIHLLFYDNYLI